MNKLFLFYLVTGLLSGAHAQINTRAQNASTDKPGIGVVVLADSDPRYALLQQIEEGYCQGKTTHSCSVSLEDCTKFMGQTTSIIDPGDKEVLQILLKQCRIRATSFEVPGMHWLLEGRLDAVQNAASSIHSTLPQRPIIGAVPVRDVNASASPFEVPIILINVQFTEFVNEFAKSAAKSIPVRSVDGQYAIDSSVAASVANISKDISLRQSFIGLIRYLRTGSGGSYSPPSEFSKTIQIVYTEGIETFAVAHEYGHLYLKHPASALNDSLYTSPDTNLIDGENKGLPLAIRELEADAFGLRILRARQLFHTSNQADNSFFSNLLISVEFYFISRHILKLADMPTGFFEAPLSDQQKNDAQKVALCIAKEGCLIREILPIDSLKDMDVYPSDAFRLEVVQQFRKMVDKDFEGTPLRRVAVLLNRNASLLWEGSEAEYRGK